MTGAEKIRAAFSEQGTAEVAAVIPYEGLYVRDNWAELTSYPWWWQHEPDFDRQLAWRRSIHESTGHDWICLPWGYTREERLRFEIIETPEGVFRCDSDTGERTRLIPPTRGGWNASGKVESVQREVLARSLEEIDAAIPVGPVDGAKELVAAGRRDLADAIMADFGSKLYPIAHVNSPLWQCYGLWGFEGFMTMVAEAPELVERACERYLSSAIGGVHAARMLGAEGVWIEECITDQVSPQAFSRLNVPYVAQLVDEIRAQGMKSIYYFCGNPAGKWDLILSVGADALALEESKKAFSIDIDEVVDIVRGRCVVLGNIDAVGVLQDGSEEHLKHEIARQMAAGRRNGGKFIMSLGSPATPDTPPQRLRLYCDLTHEMRL